MHALSHFQPNQACGFDDFALNQAKKKGETMIWKVKYYGRSVSRAKPALSGAALKEFTFGEFVEVVDYHLKWLKIAHRDERGKLEKGESWLLAVDLWSNVDLMIAASEEEVTKVRGEWAKVNKKKKKKKKAPRHSPELNAAHPLSSYTQRHPQLNATAPQTAQRPLPSGVEGPQRPPQGSPDGPQPAPQPHTANPLPPPAGVPPPDAVRLEMIEKAMQKELDEQDRLRNIRLASMHTSSAVRSNTSNMPAHMDYEDDPAHPRGEWGRGTKVSVWSSSNKQWFPGVIVKVVDPGTPKEKIAVHYKIQTGQKNQKVMPRWSKLVRSRATTKPSPTSSAAEETENKENKQTQNGSQGNADPTHQSSSAQAVDAQASPEGNAPTSSNTPATEKVAPTKSSSEEDDVQAVTAAVAVTTVTGTKKNNDLPPIPDAAKVETASDSDYEDQEDAPATDPQMPPTRRAAIASRMPEPNQLPVGWTEHKDKRSGRYYYNNKADGVTLWDTQAVKRGIISRIRPS